MLCSPAQTIPEGDYVVEPKYDGVRCISVIDSVGVPKLLSRTGGEFTTLDYIANMLSALPASTMLDGEIVDLTSERQWNRAQSITARKKPHLLSADDPPLTYMLFDVLELRGTNVMGEPLAQRRELLKLIGELLDRGANNRFGTLVGVVPEAAPGTAEEFYMDLLDQEWEGVVCKRADSIYVPGARNGGWIKVKPELEMDVEVTGTYAPAEGSKYEGNAVGGITFRATHEDGTTYDGRCAGMDDKLREALHNDPGQYVGKVAVVAYAQVTDAGALRFPRFKRFREAIDKSVTELTPSVDVSQSKAFLLTRALEAEERVEELEAEVTDLRKRLDSAINARYAIDPKPELAPEVEPSTTEHAPRAGAKRRNYKAMADDKLIEQIGSLQRCDHGEGHAKALETERNGGWSLSRHLHEALQVAASRGLQP